MSLLEQFFTELSSAADDWNLRAVMADWLEDNGQPAQAECLRWMVRNTKRPYRGYRQGQVAVATWFNADAIRAGLGDPESDLPGQLFEMLEGGKEVGNHKTFASIRHAEEAIQSAWARARAKGWGPAD